MVRYGSPVYHRSRKEEKKTEVEYINSADKGFSSTDTIQVVETQFNSIYVTIIEPAPPRLRWTI